MHFVEAVIAWLMNGKKRNFKVVINKKKMSWTIVVNSVIKIEYNFIFFW